MMLEMDEAHDASRRRCNNNAWTTIHRQQQQQQQQLSSVVLQRSGLAPFFVTRSHVVLLEQTISPSIKY
jgi:hypothetical protein